MEVHDRLGRFWLPEAADDQFPGVLAFGETEVSLQLLGVFNADRRREYGLPTGITHSVILGSLENYTEPVTILGSELIFTNGLQWSNYHANAVVLGAHTDETGSLDSDGLHFELGGLDRVFPWASHTFSIIAPHDAEHMFVAESLPSRHIETDVDPGMVLAIHSGVAVSAGGSTAFSSYHRPRLLGAARSFHDYVNAAKKIRDLIEILTGERQRIGSFTLRSGQEGAPRLRFIWPALERQVQSDESDDSRRRGHASVRAPDVLERDDGGDATTEDWNAALQRLAGHWIQWSTTNERTVFNLRDPLLRLESTPWDVFVANYAAVESYAKIRIGAAVEDEEHSSRVAAVLNALPADLPERRWVESVLQGRRGKGQQRLIMELISLIGASTLIEDAEIFSRRVTSLRGRASHGDRTADSRELSRYANRLRALVLLGYLQETGCAPTVLDRFGERLSRRIDEQH